MQEIIASQDWSFLLDLFIAMICGVAIGLERELRNKPAGISTQTLVVTGSMLFAFMSREVGGGDPSRIAAQIVSGVGFLGAGIILKSEAKSKITNLTTAASIWYSAAVGMAIGFGLYLVAIAATVYAIIITSIPHVRKYKDE